MARSAKPSFYSETALLLRALKGKRVLFLSHVRPDWDTLASAYALSQFFSPHAKTTFGVCDAPDPQRVPFFAHFTPKVAVAPVLKEYDVVVCVDFRTPAQAGNLAAQFDQYSGKVILVDHHHAPTSEFSRPVLSLLRPSAIAAAQMVAEIGMELDADFSKPVARALAVAMISDSVRFLMANEETFSVMDFLLKECATPYEKILELANPPLSSSARISIFNALKRAQLVEIGSYVLAFAHHPYHGSLTSNALIQSGADVGVGLFDSKEGLFASIRVSEKANMELKFDAMKTILPFAKEHNGSAGGHARAAQLNLPAYFSESIMIDFFQRALLEKVRKKEPGAVIKKR